MDARELTRDEKKKIRSLVTGMCANYDRESSLCLPLDCACYMLHKCWTGAYCRYSVSYTHLDVYKRQDKGYICYEEDAQESVVLRELLDKKLWKIPDRIKDKGQFRSY